MRFLVTNRAREGKRWLGDVASGNRLTYLSGDDAGTEMDGPAFRRAVMDECARQVREGVESPLILAFVHGYNVDHSDAIRWGARLEANLTGEMPGPPVVVVFDWPSEGMVTNYVDDRDVARLSAPALHRLVREAVRALDAERCPARLAVMAHSMGAYLLAHAAGHAWSGLGRPEALGVFAESLLVAPDLDDNALEPERNGWALAALSRRLTVWRSGHDTPLLASSIKRAGVTGGRLGRQGPARPSPIPRNAAIVDASAFAVSGAHSAYFEDPRLLSDIRAVLEGMDREIIPGRVRAGSELRLVGADVAALP